MVGLTLLAARIAAIRDAVARIRSVLRNLVPHHYGALDWGRVHEVAATRLDDLLAYCDALPRASGRETGAD